MGCLTGMDSDFWNARSVMRAEAAELRFPPYLTRTRRSWESGMAELVT